MMLKYRPAEAAVMKLGVHKKWTPQPITQKLVALPPAPPLSFGRIQAINRVTGFNTLYGDCVPTFCCNAAQTFLGRRGQYHPIPDSAALSIYGSVTGFQMNDPTTDQGTDPEDMFAWWQTNAIANVLLKGVRYIDPTNEQDIYETISTTGFVGLVLAMSVEMQNQVDWTAAGTPGSWGMHCIIVDQYVGLTGGTTWGQGQWINESCYQQGFVVQVYELDLAMAA